MFYHLRVWLYTISHKVTYHKFPGEGHNSIDDTDEYWVKITDFLSEFE